MPPKRDMRKHMSSTGSSSSSSSSRWCPTPEQVMILEEFYRAGVKKPNATQIQHITYYLSHHGKIEAKNVFYWFQNHKTRQRQKLRKTFSKSKSYCRLITQVQLLNSTTCCQFQHGLHQAPFCNCTNSPPTSVVALLNQQDAVAGAKDYHRRLRTWAMSNNYRPGRNCDGDERCRNFLIREYDKSWWVAPAAAAAATNQTLCFRSPTQIQSSSPLRTLQLFPVKATHLREQQSLAL